MEKVKKPITWRSDHQTQRETLENVPGDFLNNDHIKNRTGV